MTRLNTRYNWGNTLSQENPDLYRQLNEVYTDITSSSNGKVTRNVSTSNPTSPASINKNFDIGDIWINESSNTAWIMTSRTSAESVTWTTIT